MAAATADRTTDSDLGLERAYPVAASTTIYGGTIVCANAAGYAVPGADTAGLTYLGVAKAQADNSAGANGAINVTVDRTVGKVFYFDAAGLAITDVGAAVNVSDDQTVAKSTTNSIPIGKLDGFVNATTAAVRHDPLA